MSSYRDAAIFFLRFMADKPSAHGSPATRLLDFGCGEGRMVQEYCELNVDAYGCDVVPRWPNEGAVSDRLKSISLEPYRLPYDSDSFDAVISTSVLEHVRNKKESFTEILRVLKPGGYAMHAFPAKWYLPFEPHIHVPLVNFLWPRCPEWWFDLWAFLGVRNIFQQGASWNVVSQLNQQYFKNGVAYISNRKIEKLSMEVFGNCRWPMDFYIENASGGFARLVRRLGCNRLGAFISKQFRNVFLVQQKKER